MADNIKKMAVLHQLNQEALPVGLPSLLEKLGPEYVERSVRRWLSEMVQEGLVEKLGSKRGVKYRIKQHNSELRDSTSACFGKESEKVLSQVRRPLFERSPVAYAEEWFESYQPNKTYYISQELRLALHKAGKRSKREDPAGTYAHQIFNRLLIDLSYNSSRLEGNTYSLLDTQRLVLEGASVEGKLDAEKIMILNHKEAIRYMVDHASKLEINDHTIYTIHYLLSDGLVEAQYAGKIRDHGVRIGGSTYIPYEDPKLLQLKLSQITNKASLIQDPFEQSLFLLIHITYLQAFTDVNKRTSRISANIPLIKNNFVPLSFNDVDKDGYTSAVIAIYELQDIRPMLDLYVFSYMRTCALYDSTVKAIGFDEIRVRYRQKRRMLLSKIILKKLAGRALKDFISLQALEQVGEQDRSAFIEDVFEDLREIDQNRIAGLGVTPSQLDDWIAVQKS